MSRLPETTTGLSELDVLLDGIPPGPGEPRELETARAEAVKRLCRMMISRDPRILELAEKYLEPATLVSVHQRLIGTGMIGGTSAGMLLARAILRRNGPRWQELLEADDSFFVGSDVFHTYLVDNQCCWPERQLQPDATYAFEQASIVRARMMNGKFSSEVVARFQEMLEHFEQSPIIVRSSGLIEDTFGTTFSGKYESVFCSNQGPPERRLEQLLSAVRTVYASTMLEDALKYRAHLGLLNRDEQLALLVQRVSGRCRGNLHYPDVSGVAYSFNPFAWSPDLDPKAGMARLVVGLGSRAVDRRFDDYTRVVALDAPRLRPDTGDGEARRHAQMNVVVVELEGQGLSSRPFDQLARGASDLPLHLLTSIDEGLARYARERGESSISARVLSFEGLLNSTEFTRDLRGLLGVLQEAYAHPVDIEFAVNFTGESSYLIQVLRCRPFQVRGDLASTSIPEQLGRERTLLDTAGPVIGQSIVTHVDAIVYVSPREYGALPMSKRHAVARLVGKLTRGGIAGESGSPVILLVGPGRWATTTPALGVPVSFAEIKNARIVCEIAAMHEGLVPELSLATHFFNDLVELGMVYLAIHPDRPGNVVNHELLAHLPNALLSLRPEAAPLESVVRVVLARDVERELGRPLAVSADALAQRGVLYLR